MSPPNRHAAAATHRRVEGNPSDETGRLCQRVLVAVWGHRHAVPTGGVTLRDRRLVAVLGSELGTSVLFEGFWRYLTS
jgi:hypothetical protein